MYAVVFLVTSPAVQRSQIVSLLLTAFDVDVLASIGSDGAELLWRVSLDGTQAQKLCDLRSVLGVPRAATPTTRVCWHPSNLGVMAMVNGNTVRVLNVADLMYVVGWVGCHDKCAAWVGLVTFGA